MKNEETTNRNNASDDPSGISYAENARRDGIARGVRTTAIISLLILVAAGVVAWLGFSRHQEKQLALMENERVPSMRCCQFVTQPERLASDVHPD